MAARSDGTARAWGLNSSGQLGNATMSSSSVPVTVSGIANASRVAAGGAHSLAVRTDGSVVSWGDGDYGQLGNALNSDSSVPVAVSAFDQSTAVAAGGSHSVATRADETIWAWGRGHSGQLGNETTQNSNSPVQAKGLLTLQAPATSTYSYDGDGLRASKTVDGQTSPFIWDVAEGLPMLLEDGVMRYIYGPGGIPVMQINLATQVPHYFHHDQLGSSRVLTNASGNTSATFTYDAYGALKTKTGSAVTALGFTGQYTDAETGFQYLRARYYDPGTGQFVSRDPMLEITEQPYSYADGDPLNFTDPAGLWRPPSWKWRSGGAASTETSCDIEFDLAPEGCPKWVHEGSKLLGAGWMFRAARHFGRGEWRDMWAQILPGYSIQTMLGSISGAFKESAKLGGKVLPRLGGVISGAGIGFTVLDGACVFFARE